MKIGLQSYECSKSKNYYKYVKKRGQIQYCSCRATCARDHKGRTCRKRQPNYLQYTIDAKEFLYSLKRDDSMKVE